MKSSHFCKLAVTASLVMGIVSVWGGDQFWTEFVHLKSACSP